VGVSQRVPRAQRLATAGDVGEPAAASWRSGRTGSRRRCRSAVPRRARAGTAEPAATARHGRARSSDRYRRPGRARSAPPGSPRSWRGGTRRVPGRGITPRRCRTRCVPDGEPARPAHTMPGGRSAHATEARRTARTQCRCTHQLTGGERAVHQRGVEPVVGRRADLTHPDDQPFLYQHHANLPLSPVQPPGVGTPLSAPVSSVDCWLLSACRPGFCRWPGLYSNT
jgi:hypothetical protein